MLACICGGVIEGCAVALATVCVGLWRFIRRGK